MAGDIREFVESCPTCQLEKTDHTQRKGSLQSLAIPEAKWQEVRDVRLYYGFATLRSRDG